MNNAVFGVGAMLDMPISGAAPHAQTRRILQHKFNYLSSVTARVASDRVGRSSYAKGGRGVAGFQPDCRDECHGRHL